MQFLTDSVDVSSSGQSQPIDITDDGGSVAWLFDLTALSGGVAPTVTVHWEHSPDGTNWYNVASEAALSAVGSRQRVVRECHHSRVRVRWVTTGGPSTATARIGVNATR